MESQPSLDGIELFLFDIDGVFLEGKETPRLISGRRIIPALRNRGIPFRLVTNTSTHPPAFLVERLAALGVEVAKSQIHSALTVTVGVVAERFPGGRCLVVGEAGLSRALQQRGLSIVHETPADVVVVGLTREAHYRQLSAAARCILAGAPLLGCHRLKLWVDPQSGHALSSGAWIAALEYATGVTAETFGKPAATFYQLATADLGIPAQRILMVGDDPLGDVAGAQAAGMRAALVLSGKTSQQEVSRGETRPDWILQRADDLVGLLPNGGGT